MYTAHIFKKNLGFTLLEIVIVISIIGLLLIMGTAAYTLTLKKSRDSQRIQNLKALQGAQEQYHSLHGQYAELDDEALSPCAVSTIFPQGISDPSHQADSVNCLSCGAADFTAYCASLSVEDTAKANCSECSASDCSASTLNPLTRYCVTNLQ